MSRLIGEISGPAGQMMLRQTWHVLGFEVVPPGTPWSVYSARQGVFNRGIISPEGIFDNPINNRIVTLGAAGDLGVGDAVLWSGSLTYITDVADGIRFDISDANPIGELYFYTWNYADSEVSTTIYMADVGTVSDLSWGMIGMRSLLSAQDDGWWAGVGWDVGNARWAPYYQIRNAGSNVNAVKATDFTTWVTDPATGIHTDVWTVKRGNEDWTQMQLRWSEGPLGASELDNQNNVLLGASRDVYGVAPKVITIQCAQGAPGDSFSVIFKDLHFQTMQPSYIVI